MYPPNNRISDIKKPKSFRPVSLWEERVPENNIYTNTFVTHETPPSFSPPSWNVTRRKKSPRGKREGIAIIIFLLVIFFGAVFYYAKNVKEEVLMKSEVGFENLSSAMENLKTKDYVAALVNFNRAAKSFEDAESGLIVWGGTVAEYLRYVPGFSELASGKYALESGVHFSLAGVSLTEIAMNASLSHDAYVQGEKVSLLDMLTRIKKPLATARMELEKGNVTLNKVRLEDIPEEKRGKFLDVKESVPTILQLLTGFDKHEVLVHELLGGNGPRKYLFLLQNNHEMRATGGFIGSYALLEVNDGVVKRFFVDGIFNPDGQLKENIVPPKPIQKISAAWSLHDSNWFPDFPTSAEKAMYFYEKTGGPTVDGVITLTPTVMQKLLAVTGPIALPEYGLTVDSENFIPVIQEQVEVKYDREENKPKKILADLSVILIEKVFASQDKETLYKIGQALVDGLNEKQMLLYMRHEETETLIEEAGWSGKIYDTQKDYLSVIHSNINGYKTDGVIDEVIKHKSEIKEDGSVVDTVTITRSHRGGNTPYEWWNKVNADYLRVYVPKGSQLLSAKGTTWEFPEAPLDYARLGFKQDETVTKEEKDMIIDQKTGTRISMDAGKTVFGAWVYVSPQESVTVEYQYRLPFRVTLDKKKENTGRYSILFQKQAGSNGSKLDFSLLYPKTWKVIWQTSSNLVPYERELHLETDLKTDAFAGAVFGSQE